MAQQLKLLLASAILLAPFARAQDPTIPAADGYVTRTLSGGFDVNGYHILVNSRTGAGLKANGFVSVGNAHELAPYVGERATVFGKKNDQTHSIEAEKIVLDPQKLGDVSGAGMVDWTQPSISPSTSPDRLIRADGYQILITAKTKMNFRPPLAAGAPIQTNQWLEFKGKQRPDGVVVADTATVATNVINKSENKLLDKTDYDPDTVDDDAKQSAVSKFFKGRDPKQIPPYDDPAMQARITAIGNRLIPQYQRDLPESDLTKIIFRFQLVDEKALHTPWSLPSGIILIPRAFVERMQNDSQLAAVLAARIAQAIEKQAWHTQQINRKLTGAQIAGDVVGALIPGVGLLTAIGTTSTGVHIEHVYEDQISRTSLWLLHDAGFDLTEAPRAWWLLNGKEGKDLSQIKLPRRTGVLYDQLSTTWRQTVSPPPTSR